MKSMKGFTLVEVMISLSIFLMLTSLVPQFIKLIPTQEAKTFQQIETSIFLQQLALELQTAKDITITNETLYLRLSENELVSYARLQNHIRRQVNRQGQEIVLQRIKSVEFSEYKGAVHIQIIDVFNQLYENKTIPLLRAQANEK